jgi:hypothetical protein
MAAATPYLIIDFHQRHQPSRPPAFALLRQLHRLLQDRDVTEVETIFRDTQGLILIGDRTAEYHIEGCLYLTQPDADRWRIEYLEVFRRDDYVSVVRALVSYVLDVYFFPGLEVEGPSQVEVSAQVSAHPLSLNFWRELGATYHEFIRVALPMVEEESRRRPLRVRWSHAVGRPKEP